MNEAATLNHLQTLVAHDTRNPPRALTTNDALWDYLGRHAPGFDIELIDHGDGCISWLAVRGQPKLLFNVHLDTVPLADGWSFNPHELTIKENRAYGLGACDIKGAAAVLLIIAADCDDDMAILFSTDEEAGGGQCIKAFLQNDHPFERVVVAEPTDCQAIMSHRGIASVELQFKGASAHSSVAVSDSAIHKAAQWMTAALQATQSSSEGDLRFNIGRIEGGIKPNMVAQDAIVRFGFRAPPGVAAQPVIDHLVALKPTPASSQVNFLGPALPDQTDVAAEQRIERWINAADVDIGDPVNFWTECALFRQAGLDSVVLGSGNIAQAHAVDEWVEVSQLTKLYGCYRRLIDGQR